MASNPCFCLTLGDSRGTFRWPRNRPPFDGGSALIPHPVVRVGAMLLATLVLGGGFLAMVHGVAVEVTTPVDLPRVPYATSRTCVMCHPGRFETWHRTFHRTMTQRADRASVRGDFESASLVYQGVASRFTREGERHFIETLGPTGAMERHEVVMTVGSRRVQQYVAQIGGRHVRLPLAWNIEERRWIHLNGGFLHPDGSDFNTHRADWDNNCIFCHNVKAQPRYDEATNSFDPRVAELGIACEACHGPADLHVKRNSDPLRRYLLHLGGRDPTIVSPRELKMRTWERGSGITRACGTGASAVCVAGVLAGRTRHEILAHLPGGDLPHRVVVGLRRRRLLPDVDAGDVHPVIGGPVVPQPGDAGVLDVPVPHQVRQPLLVEVLVGDPVQRGAALGSRASAPPGPAVVDLVQRSPQHRHTGVLELPQVGHDLVEPGLPRAVELGAVGDQLLAAALDRQVDVGAVGEVVVHRKDRRDPRSRGDERGGHHLRQLIREVPVVKADGPVERLGAVAQRDPPAGARVEDPVLRHCQP